MDLLSGKKIHEGKFSIIYFVEHKGEKFIVKQLHPRHSESTEAIYQFRLEAQWPDIDGIHPRKIDYREYLGGQYLVREYIEGITLKQINTSYRRKKHHPYFKNIFVKICDKLSVLHSMGIIHGDIKPSNILLKGNDFLDVSADIRLLDLGLSVKKDHLPEKRKDQSLHFSMVYSAPELMLNEPLFISELTDLFSAGICMFESFSGEVPYHENHPAVLLQMMLAVELKKRNKISGELIDVISILCSKPGFKKPIAHYTVDEVNEFLRLNLEIRSKISSANQLKEKLESIW